MATQLQPPPPTASNTHDPQGSEVVQPTNVDPQNVKEEPAKPSSTTSVFVNSQPLREEQVQNAVKFLSHPKVRGSPVIYRRSFLEKKGLTKEEIDEAFQRVPDSAPTVQTAGVNQDGQLKSSSNIQQQTLQPALPASTSVNTSSVSLSRSRFHWSHALVAVGLLAASGAGTAIIIKKTILPRLKSWIRNVVLDNEEEQLKKTDNKPTLMEEAAQAAKSAAAAAADVAKASQEMLASKDEERRYLVEVVSLLDKQVQEMKSMTNAIRRLEGQEDLRISQTTSKQLIVNGKVDHDLRSGGHIVRSSSAPASVEPPSGLHPKSHMEIMDMVQRGEKPNNIRPWEVGQVQSASTQSLQSQVNGEDLNTKAQDTPLLNGDDPLPWWQRKNVRIREIDNENESNGVPYAAASSQQPVQRVWVPPQPPPVAMPGAAEAIRRPKPVVQKEQMSDNQSVVHSSDASDDVQRVSKLLEFEGTVEGSSVNSVPSSAEIQEVREVKHDEK